MGSRFSELLTMARATSLHPSSVKASGAYCISNMRYYLSCGRCLNPDMRYWNASLASFVRYQQI